MRISCRTVQLEAVRGVTTNEMIGAATGRYLIISPYQHSYLIPLPLEDCRSLGGGKADNRQLISAGSGLTDYPLVQSSRIDSLLDPIDPTQDQSTHIVQNGQTVKFRLCTLLQNIRPSNLLALTPTPLIK